MRWRAPSHGKAGGLAALALFAVLDTGWALAGEEVRNPHLKRWLLSPRPPVLSPTDRQKAFSYRQRLQSHVTALERQHNLGIHDAHGGVRNLKSHRRPVHRGIAGREVFDRLQDSRSELFRIRRALRR